MYVYRGAYDTVEPWLIRLRFPPLQDDKFLSVLYPNYMHWLLQPLKNTAFVHDESAMFDLQDSIMELLTFCTENHGYRVKYLFGRQPIASYAEKMLRSKNKLFVIRTYKAHRSRFCELFCVVLSSPGSFLTVSCIVSSVQTL